MNENRTFYEDGDPNAPPPKKFEMTADGRVVMDEDALKKRIQQIREDLQGDMVVGFLDKGIYPWILADTTLMEPDDIYEAKKHAFLYQIGSELGLSAAQAEQELMMEHLSEIVGERQMCFPMECSQDLKESQMAGSAVSMIYRNALKEKWIINEKIVLNRFGVPHLPSFETRLFRVTRGYDESWYTYNKKNDLKPYLGKVVLLEKDEDVYRALSAEIPFLKLRENEPGLEKILGKVSVRDFKSDLMTTTGLQEVEVQQIDFPQVDMSKGGLVRVLLRDGAYEWFFCSAEMLGRHDEQTVLQEYVMKKREAGESSSTSSKNDPSESAKRGILDRIKGLLGWN